MALACTVLLAVAGAAVLGGGAYYLFREEPYY